MLMSGMKMTMMTTMMTMKALSVYALLVICLTGEGAAQLGQLSATQQQPQPQEGGGGPLLQDILFGSNSSSGTGATGSISTAGAGGGWAVGGRGGGGGSGGGQRNTCSRQEERALFQNCLMAFGSEHMMWFPMLRSRRECVTRVFDCRSVNKMVTCLNAQPVNVISNQCWANIKTPLSRAFKEYGIPCTYNDLRKQCWGKSTDILTLAQRPQRRGRNVSNNPLIRIITQLYMEGNLGHALGI